MNTSIWPKVSVVIPVLDRPDMTRDLVERLWYQNYPGPIEIIVVAPPGDPTWNALQDPIKSGWVVAIEAHVETPRRDANARRNLGLQAATGEIIGLTDADIVPPPTWVSTGVNLIHDQGWHCVAGPVLSVSDHIGIHDACIVAKVPRMEQPYVLSSKNAGKIGYKLPVTANTFMDRAVLDTVGLLDPTMVVDYEDYEFYTRVVQYCQIFCTPDLRVQHHHRTNWEEILFEWWRSGIGCADFVWRHPRSTLARSRLLQLNAVIVAFAFALYVAVTGLSWLFRGASKAPTQNRTSGLPIIQTPTLDPSLDTAPAVVLWSVAVGVAVALALVLLNALKERRAIASVYPVATLALGMAFSTAMVLRLGRHFREGRSGYIPLIRAEVVAVHNGRPDIQFDLEAACGRPPSVRR